MRCEEAKDIVKHLNGVILLGVVSGAISFFSLGMFSKLPSLNWLAEYPFTRLFGLTIPVLQMVLMARSDLRQRFGHVLISGPVVYCAGAAILAAVFVVARMKWSGSIAAPLTILFLGAALGSPFAWVAVMVWKESDRTRAHRQALAMSVAVLLCIPAYDSFARVFGFPGRLADAVHRASIGDAVDLRSIESGDWSRVLVFGGYTDPEKIDCGLGRTWYDLRRQSLNLSDGHQLVMFVGNDGRVVSAYEIPRRRVEVCPKVYYLSVERDRAVFQVRTHEFYGRCLGAPEGDGVVDRCPIVVKTSSSASADVPIQLPSSK